MGFAFKLSQAHVLQRRWRQNQSDNAFEARQFRRSAILLDDQTPGEQSMGQIQQQPLNTPVYPQPTYGHLDVPYSGPTPYQPADTHLSYPESYYRRQAYPSPEPSNPEPIRSQSAGLQRSGTIYNPEDAYGGIS